MKYQVFKTTLKLDAHFLLLRSILWQAVTAHLNKCCDWPSQVGQSQLWIEWAGIGLHFHLFWSPWILPSSIEDFCVCPLCTGCELRLTFDTALSTDRFLFSIKYNTELTSCKPWVTWMIDKKLWHCYIFILYITLYI